MKSIKDFLSEAKATYCGRCGTTHVPPSKGGTCPALTKEEFEQLEEQSKTTHEDPLVTVHDKDGLHTHANLSTANRIFNTKVKHTDVHKGEVKTKDGWETKRDLKFAISKHHAAAVKESVELEESTPTKQQVKQAIGIARDKRYAGGNMTGATQAMDKINKGLAMHPAVSKELKKQNEETEELDEISADLAKRYINKAGTNFETQINKRDKAKTRADWDKHDRKAGNRHVGLSRAAKTIMRKEETQPQGDTMSTMEHYLAAIADKADFRSALDEKTLTPAELKKREEVAKAIERKNPDMPMGKKMAIATATAKKVAEETSEGDMPDAADYCHTCNTEPCICADTVSEQTVPKTAKEKSLAKLAPPHDKITHADVMKGRGVAKEGVGGAVAGGLAGAAIGGLATGGAGAATGARIGAPIGSAIQDKMSSEEKKKKMKTEMSSKEKMKRGLYNKEDVDVSEAMISYSDFMDKIATHKKAGNDIKDHKYSDSKATYTVVDKEGVGRKITHTPTGTKQEHLGSMKRNDDEDDADEVKPTEKRGRGRPSGSKSGARH